MTNTPSHSNDPSNEPAEQSEILINRIVDGEASGEDQREFQRLASQKPQLWQALAMAQQDAAQLSRGFERHVDQLTQIDLPREPRRYGRGWVWTLSGWAAVVMLAMAWFITQTVGPQRDHAFEPARPVATDNGSSVAATPEQQLRQYLAAPFVLGQLDPIMLEVEELPDGRLAVRFIRRIEEVLHLDREQSLPIDEDGRFITDPATLRDDSDRRSLAPGS